MAKGGKREGSGRKKGTLNKRDWRVSDFAPDVQRIFAQRMTCGDPEKEWEAAKEAAKYLWPRQTTVSGPDGGAVKLAIDLRE